MTQHHAFDDIIAQVFRAIDQPIVDDKPSVSFTLVSRDPAEISLTPGSVVRGESPSLELATEARGLDSDSVSYSQHQAQGPSPDALAEVNGFDIFEEVGRGGMGAVHRARDRATGRIVAIKFLDRDRINSRVARIRFEREIRLAAQLEHPHIARIYDAGLADDQCFYVMEYVDGMAFDRHVRRNKCTISETLSLFMKICRAVEYAHRQNVIHRDIKPSNILIRSDGEPRIVDFGLAKSCTLEAGDSAEDGLSIEGHVAGSPGYMSPEQAAGQVLEIDQRSDVYALGAVLFKVLTSEHPHEQTGPLYAIVQRVVVEPVRKPRMLNRRIPRALEAILLTALAKDKDDRYPTPAMMADDIDAYIQGKPLRANLMTPGRLWPSLHHQAATMFAPTIGLILCLTIAVIVGALYLQNQRYQAQQEQHRVFIEAQLRELQEENAAQDAPAATPIPQAESAAPPQ